MMNWRSRPLALFLPIAFLFLPQPEGGWARGRGHGYGHHHDHHHPSHHHFFGFGHLYGYASCGHGSPAGREQTVIPGSPQVPAKEAQAAWSPRSETSRRKCIPDRP
jgi:hypothetical protein